MFSLESFTNEQSQYEQILKNLNNDLLSNVAKEDDIFYKRSHDGDDFRLQKYLNRKFKFKSKNKETKLY
jgi:hypothetical protein